MTFSAFILMFMFGFVSGAATVFLTLTLDAPNDIISRQNDD